MSMETTRVTSASNIKFWQYFFCNQGTKFNLKVEET